MLNIMNAEVVSAQEVEFAIASREIFFIDDDEEELGIFQMAMKEVKDVSFNLHYAKSGDVFLNSLGDAVPDLIFLDLHMPGKSGITVLKMLRYNKKYDSIPIVIYSKLSNPSFVDDCYNARANYYLIKPVSVRKLTKAIKKVIDAGWDACELRNRAEFIIEE